MTRLPPRVARQRMIGGPRFPAPSARAVKRRRSPLWAAFVSLLYFIHGVGEAVANPDQRWLGLTEIGLSLLLFFAASLYARWGAEAQA